MRNRHRHSKWKNVMLASLMSKSGAKSYVIEIIA
jgi:hypothetical protein